jgi:REP element-mobilizing transposase RayT
MNRGARRAPIFKVGSDCTLFLDTVGEMVSRSRVEVHAYALMPNHFHLLIRSPRANLSRAMRHLMASYSQRMNRLHGWDGPLFRGRVRSELVRREEHLRYLVAYLHLNPVRANLAKRVDDENLFTSHLAYLGHHATPGWLTTAELTSLLGGRPRLDKFVQALHNGRRDWPEAMRLDTGFEGLTAEGDADLKPTPAREAADPERVLSRICAICNVSKPALRRVVRGPGGNPARRFATWALQRELDLSYVEVGHLLGMSSDNVAKVLQAIRSGRTSEQVKSWLARWNEA